MSYDELLDSLTARIMALPGNPQDNAALFGALLAGAREGKGGARPDEI